jgi:uncharacterized protein YndB with AHSA1/START domain
VHIEISTLLDAPPAEVWADIVDIGSHVEWMEDAESIRFESSLHSGVGTAFVCRTALGPFRMLDRMEVTEWEPGAVMGIRHAGLVTGTGRFVLSPAGGGGQTRFTWAEDLVFPVWLGGAAGAAIARPVLQRVWRKNLENLARRFSAR